MSLFFFLDVGKPYFYLFIYIKNNTTVGENILPPFGFRRLTKSTEFACRIRVHDAETWGALCDVTPWARNGTHHQIRIQIYVLFFDLYMLSLF